MALIDVSPPRRERIDLWHTPRATLGALKGFSLSHCSRPIAPSRVPDRVNDAGR